jgi:hypothetical protein
VCECEMLEILSLTGRRFESISQIYSLKKSSI